MSHSVITVNRFIFCVDHGNEFCHVCNQDYRAINNRVADVRRQLVGRLGPDFEENNGFLLEERYPINIYALGVDVNTRNPRAFGICIDHAAVDCTQCYDWIKLIEAEATGDGFNAVRGRQIKTG